jgi:hypothetical protein
MNDKEHEERKARAANETLVIAPTEGGFRVYSPANITRIFMVSGIPESPQCNCGESERHKRDSGWRCTHIVAVLNQMEKSRGSKPNTETPGAQERSKSESKASEPGERKRQKTPRRGQHSQMIIKRSVSPDGRINSMSVVFVNPIDDGTDEEIKQRAKKALKLQAEIVDEFLKRKESRGPEGQQPQAKAGSAGNETGSNETSAGPPANGSNGAVPAQLLNIAGMNTRGGWKTFINVQVNGTTTKLFGSKHELGEHITAAGFPNIAEHINQGMMLKLPCRVVTKRSADGKYLNIERVLPIKPLEEPTRRNQ